VEEVCFERRSKRGVDRSSVDNDELTEIERK